MKTATLFVFAALSAACITAPKRPPLTPTEQAEFDAVMATPLTIQMTTEDGALAWGRAQVWVQNNSVMKIQTVSDFIIETYNLNCESTGGTKYTAQRMPLTKDTVQISVNALSCWVGKEQTTVNAHVMAYYVKTGKLACDRNGKSAVLSQ
jgi:hypothetical protein